MQHTNEFPFVCPYEGCERRFKSRSALNYHTKTHSGQKEYVCTFGDCKMKWVDILCFFISSRFLSRSNLKKHMLSHSQQADFHCPFCERKYKRKWDLSRHIKKAHQSRGEEENRYELLCLSSMQ